MTEQEYTYAEHRFRFAAWAAARAVKKLSAEKSDKKLTTILTDILRKVFFDKEPKEQLKDEELGNDWILKIGYSDDKHACWRKHICKLSEEKEITHTDPKERTMSHGQAAKLINVFIKSLMPSDMYSISPELKERWDRVHPPIDRILLTNMDKERFGGKKDWGKVAWTQLKSSEYQRLIDNIKKHEPCLWKIERFWKV